MATPVKLDLKRTQRLRVEWDDGREDVLPLPRLRAGCPCASCREQRGEKHVAIQTRPARGKRLAVLAAAPDDAALHVEKVEKVGNYALRFHWSDGHSTGIYSWRHLRELGDATHR